MGRYIGPKERLSRRAGRELYLKGARILAGKGALERRGPVPPGEHGRRRRGTPSTYALQLHEKRVALDYYGVRERQLRGLVDRAVRAEGRSGDVLLELLERRLDNVVYRMGFAATRAQARQLVSHCHVLVDGGRCNILSRRLRPGMVVSIRPNSAAIPIVRDATELCGGVPSWLLADHESLTGRVISNPRRDEIDAPIQEQLIIEYYAAR